MIHKDELQREISLTLDMMRGAPMVENVSNWTQIKPALADAGYDAGRTDG